MTNFHTVQPITQEETVNFVRKMEADIVNEVPVYSDAWNKLQQHEWKADVCYTDVCCTECQYIVQFRPASCRLKKRP